MAIWELDLRDEHFQLIKEGKKTVEGRAPSEKVSYTKMKVWDEIVFANLDTGEKLEAMITGVAWYSDIRQMLKSEGLEKVLPGVKTIEDGVWKWWGVRDYRKRRESTEKGGIWAIRFCLITKQRGA